MLRAAGMHAEVRETQHAGHATELAHDLDLSQSSALVVVGGDGTVHEVLQVGRQPRLMFARVCMPGCERCQGVCGRQTPPKYEVDQFHLVLCCKPHLGPWLMSRAALHSWCGARGSGRDSL